MRRVVLLALLAGCLAPASDAPSADAVTALVFGEAVRPPGEQVAAEPNLAAGPDGRVWVIAPGSVLGQPNAARAEVSLWTSNDAGGTWTSLRAPAKEGPFAGTGQICSCDADVDLGPDGMLYITDFWIAGAANGFVVEASADGGKTWGTPNPITVTNLAANDRQYVTAGREPGRVYLSYARGATAGGQPDAGLHLWRSDDAGSTFASRAQPFVASASAWAFIARPVVAPDGAVHFPWTEVPPGDEWNGKATVVVATSRDHGVSFERVEVAPIANGVGGLWPLEAAVGADGTLHLAWMERVPDGGSVLSYASSRDGGATFSAPRRVGWPDGTAFLPWVAATDDGRAIVAFYGTRAALDPFEAPADTRWDAWALTVGANGATEPARVSPFPVKVGTFCPQGASCPEDRELLDYPAVAWRDGVVYVAFAASILDEGAGPGREEEPTGGHATAAHVYVATAPLG